MFDTAVVIALIAFSTGVRKSPADFSALPTIGMSSPNNLPVSSVLHRRQVGVDFADDVEIVAQQVDVGEQAGQVRHAERHVRGDAAGIGQQIGGELAQVGDAEGSVPRALLAVGAAIGRLTVAWPSIVAVIGPLPP